MVRSEFIGHLVERFPALTHKDATRAVVVFFGEIITALARGERVEVRGFGIFL